MSDMDRRRFVRKATLGAVAVRAGAAALLSGPVWIPAREHRRAQRSFPYLGARRIRGPAPKGVPLIPIRRRDDDVFEVVPQKAGAAPLHGLLWYAFCGREDAPGLRPSYPGDNVLRYHQNEAKVRAIERDFGEPPWYADKLGREVRASDFTEVGQGAPFLWRSEGQEQNNVLTGVVIRMDLARLRGQDASDVAAGEFMAFSDVCTHYCCRAGYHESREPQISGVWDSIYCTCHSAAFDPYDIREYNAPANVD